QAKVMADAIDVLVRQGAVVVDPADIPSAIESDAAKNINQWNICSGAGNSKGNDTNCSVVLKYGMKRDFNRWLATLGPSAPVKTMAELREWNLAHTKAGAIRFGQYLLDISDEIDVQAVRVRYDIDRAKYVALAGISGLVELM